jgi:cytochrome P450
VDSERDTLEVDPHSEKFTAPDYAQRVANWNGLRNRCPVAWNSNHDGFWILSNYESVALASKDDKTFSHTFDLEAEDGLSYIGQLGIPRPDFTTKMIIGESDGQFHEDLRRALNPLFTPARSRAYQPFMQQAADWFLDQYAESGSIDFIDEFIAPVTALTTVHVLGLPTSAWADSVDVFHGLMAFTPGSERYERALNEQSPALMSVFMDVAKERRKVPRDDVITTIASLTVDGRLLNDEELSLVIFNLVSGGVDTTTGFTGMSLKHLDQDRATRAKLIEDRQLIEPATEELLRLYGSVQCLSRTVTADIEVGGQTMRRGDRALIVHAAANRDPAEFKEPDQFDLDRTRNRHLSFGLSSHRCLGAHIARIVFQTMLTTILTRIPDYSIVQDRVVQYEGNPELIGLLSLPAEFTPRPASGVMQPFD